MKFLKKIKKFLSLRRIIELLLSKKRDCIISNKAIIYAPYNLSDCSVGDYSYIGPSSHLSQVVVGKFCSIGPGFFAGWGIHPINGISTHPMFYSAKYENTFSETNKIEERKRIFIGNDVFIGARVIVLDGVKIGNGAVIGAGAVVTKDVDDYAIMVGVPATLLRYRFENEIIGSLGQIQWWNFDEKGLKEVEENFFEVERLVANHIIQY